MTSETVIITGGNGFVGRHLINELRREAPTTQLVVWDRSVEELADGVVGVVMDITKPETYGESLRSEQPVWIVHLAAVPSATLASQNEEYARRVNVEGTRRLLEEVRRVSPGTRVLAVSSADIYGNIMESPPPSPRLAGLRRAGPPIRRAGPPMRRAGLSELPLEQARPRNVYAQTKWEMEKMIEQRFNDLVVRVRSFPHIGPGQTRGYVTADFASQIAAAEAGRGEPVIKVGNLEAQRDFTDVRDVVRAYRLLMRQGEIGEAYNVAAGRAVSIQHILDKLLELSEVEVKVEQDPKLMRPTDIPVLVGDSAKLRALTGWRPTISLDRSLKDVIGWWRNSVVL